MNCKLVGCLVLFTFSIIFHNQLILTNIMEDFDCQNILLHLVLIAHYCSMSVDLRVRARARTGFAFYNSVEEKHNGWARLFENRPYTKRKNYF